MDILKSSAAENTARSNGCDPNRQTSKLNIYRAYASAFPPYLPRRYHSMDGVQMQMLSTESGDYWANVARFLSVTIDHATVPIYNLTKGQQFDVEPNHQSNWDTSETAAEFLLEPWVLLQLPFQPALLHQWAVIALVETLSYCRMLVKFSTMGRAPQVDDMYLKLAEISRTLTKNCNMFLYYFHSYCSDPTENIHTHAKRILPLFSDQLSETVAALEFILGEDCTKALDIIECVTGGIDPAKRVYSKNHTEIGCFDSAPLKQTPAYSYSFWCNSWSFASACFDNFSDENKFNMVKRLLKETCSEELDLEGLSPEQICKFKQTFTKTWEHNVLYRDLVKFNKAGPVKIIMDSYGAILVKHVLSYVESLFLQNTPSLQESQDSNRNVPEIELQRLMLTIAGVQANRQQWTLDSIMSKAESSNHGVPSDTGPIEAAESFSMRIRSLVLKMYTQQYKSLHDEVFIFYPECHFVQYTLPCFVAMYLDIAKDPHLQMERKVRFLRFVSKLINAYEEIPAIQELDSPLKKLPLIHPLERPDQTLYSIANFFLEQFQSSEKVQKAVGKLEIIIDKAYKGVVPINHPRPELFFYTNYYVQLYMLNGRIKDAIYYSRWPGFNSEHYVHHRPLCLSVLTFLKGGFTYVDCLLDSMDFRPREADLPVEFAFSMVANGQREIVNDGLHLSIGQLYRLSLHEAFQFTRPTEELLATFQTFVCSSDPFVVFADLVMRRHWMAIRQNYFKEEWMGDGGEDLGLIPLKVARRNALCRPLLKSLGPDLVLQDPTSANNAFFPIQHCRWCGTIYHVHHFRLCAECEDEPGYPDPHYFCSEACESACLAKCHLEMHATYVMEKLGLEV